MFRLKIFAIFVLIFLFLAIVDVRFVNALKIRIDFSGVVDYVVDGDTFDVTLINGTSFRVRLADVNAVEFGESGYFEAKDYLKSLVYEKTVYLDVDDLYTYENHGTGDRLICVPYVEYNTTHLMNVNEALFQAGQVKLKNYDNEFSHYNWELYISKQDVIPEFPAIILLFVTMILILVISGLTRNVNCSKKTKNIS
jgi:endonuclease YncB( thermonuclease family)